MARMDDLERRVADLEQALESLQGNDSGPAAGPEGERFWALEALRARVTPETGAVLFTGIVHTAAGDYEWQETRPDTELLTTGWEEAGTALAALASPVRMRLLSEVLGGRGSAAELAEVEGFGTSGQIYHHLRQLTGAGWLRAAGRARWVVPPERVVPLLAIVAAAHR